jgi:hypothetical protein
MFSQRARSSVVVLALVATSVACKSQPTNQSNATKQEPTAPLVDLSASLDAARTEFNAHKRDARFVTLLAPT